MPDYAMTFSSNIFVHIEASIPHVSQQKSKSLV